MTVASNNKRPVTGWKRNLIIGIDRAVLALARNWAAVVVVLAGLYSGIPFLAPVAMKLGWTQLADVIYDAYAPLCHQWAFRSWFLFGDSYTYPRARTGVEGPTFEDYAANDPYFDGIDLSDLDGQLVFAAKYFRGNAQMGWKVAYCERDVAIYASIALCALVYVFIVHKKVRVPYLPLWAYFILAIAPIGLDGFSQMFANPPFNGFGLPIYPIRESTPFLRVLTGSMFGLGNSWLAFPYIDESMRDTAKYLENKLTKAGVIKSD